MNDASLITNINLAQKDLKNDSNFTQTTHVTLLQL